MLKDLNFIKTYILSVLLVFHCIAEFKKHYFSQGNKVVLN